MTVEEAIIWLKDYWLIEERVALDMAIKALEKQIPKKITEIHCDEYYCPNCGAENNCDQYAVGDEYCPKCGQKLD